MATWTEEEKKRVEEVVSKEVDKLLSGGLLSATTKVKLQEKRDFYVQSVSGLMMDGYFFNNDGTTGFFAMKVWAAPELFSKFFGYLDQLLQA
eukprot:Gb_25967 [translate_table: standard]